MRFQSTPGCSQNRLSSMATVASMRYWGISSMPTQRKRGGIGRVVGFFFKLLGTLILIGLCTGALLCCFAQLLGDGGAAGDILAGEHGKHGLGGALPVYAGVLRSTSTR